MKSTQDAILKILDGHDSSNPMNRYDLLSELGARGEVVSDREMRSEVVAMILYDSQPIGTNTRGYFMVRTKKDLEAADAEMAAKESSIRQRRFALTRAYQATGRDIEVGQQTLPLEGTACTLR